MPKTQTIKQKSKRTRRHTDRRAYMHRYFILTMRNKVDEHANNHQYIKKVIKWVLCFMKYVYTFGDFIYWAKCARRPNIISCVQEGALIYVSFSLKRCVGLYSFEGVLMILCFPVGMCMLWLFSGKICLWKGYCRYVFICLSSNLQVFTEYNK